MGLFDGNFLFSDPNSMALLGAVAALSKAAQPSRMPVPTGSVFGSMAGGMLAGAQQGLQNELLGQKAAAGNLSLAQQLFTENLVRSRLGLPQISLADLQSGRSKSLFASMPALPTPAPTSTPSLASGAASSPAASPATAGTLAPGFERSATGEILRNGQPPNTMLPGGVPGWKVGGTQPQNLAANGPVVGAILDSEGTGANPRSTSEGYGGFTDGTWLATIKAARPDLAEGASDAELLQLRHDEATGREMTSALAKGNAQKLSAAGQSVNPASVYLAHLLGANGAIDALKADPETPLSKIISPAAMRANPRWRGMTVGDLEAFASNKMEAAGANVPPARSPSVAAAPATAAPVSAFAGALPPARVIPPPSNTMPVHAGTGEPAIGVPITPSGKPVNPNADFARNYVNAVLARRLGVPLTPVQQYALAASMAPPGSITRRLDEIGAIHAAGVAPYLGGERAGVPIRQYVPGRGYVTVDQNPRLPVGAGYANGRVGMLPGATGAIAAGEAAKGYGAAGPHIYESMNTPHVLGPNQSLVIPSQLGKPGTGTPNVTQSLANQGGKNAAFARSLAARSPGVLREGINPIYQKAVNDALTADQARLSKELLPAVDKANSTQIASQALDGLMTNVRMGQFADARQDLAKLMTGLGWSDAAAQKLAGTSPTAGDAFRKFSLQQVATAVRQMGAREPGSVLHMFSKAYTNLETMPGAARLLENVLFMQGQRVKDEYALAQQQHTGAMNALRSGKPYVPLSEFEAQFNTGAHSATNYLRAAQAMSEDKAAWKGLKPGQFDMIWSLIPAGRKYLAPDGTVRTKG